MGAIAGGQAREGGTTAPDDRRANNHEQGIAVNVSHKPLSFRGYGFGRSHMLIDMDAVRPSPAKEMAFR
jgi:hypothetical protein